MEPRSSDPTYGIWSMFFEKHTSFVSPAVPRQGELSSRRPPVSGGRQMSLIATVPTGPRRSRSARELSIKEANVQQNRDMPDGSAASKTHVTTEAEWEDMLRRLRKLVLQEGVPNDDVRMNKQSDVHAMLIIRL